MKTSALKIAAIALFITSCDWNDNTTIKNDSVKQAEEHNEVVFRTNDKEQDAEFTMEAASAGTMEVKLSEIARQKASSSQVKAYAEMIVTEHTQASAELKALAGRKNIALPPDMKEDHLEQYEKLAQADEKDFDKEYLDAMIDQHKKDIDDFEDCAEGASDQELKQWCAQKLTTLRKHLQQAEGIRENLK